MGPMPVCLQAVLPGVCVTRFKFKIGTLFNQSWIRDCVRFGFLLENSIKTFKLKSKLKFEIQVKFYFKITSR